MNKIKTILHTSLQRIPGKIKFEKLLITALAFLVSVSGATPTLAEQERPNVIFILTDDQGWNDAHFAGHPYAKTPNLDKLSTQSTWFKQFYAASPVCSPSRAAFLTGHFPARHRIDGHLAEHDQNVARSMADWLDPQVPTLASLLRGAGYATAHFGKWHLGRGPGAPPPEAYGFDRSKTTVSNGPQLKNNTKDFHAKSTEMIVDETINFIREHKDGAFYVNVWTLLPHAPLKPTPIQLKEYENLSPSADDPAFGPWMQKYLAKGKNLKSQMQIYCAALTDLDTQLGRLFSALDEMKLADNTIIVFSSDNGAEDYRIQNAANAGVGNTGPLRARKRSLYEGGVRTFGLVRWPGRVPAGQTDEKSVTSAVDILPTICKITGTDLPANMKLDGEDVSDIWLGKPRPRTKPLFWEWMFDVTGGPKSGYMPPMLAVRDGDWKLYVNHDGSDAQLFKIPYDISEEHDVAAENPEVVISLTAKTLVWSKSLPQNPLREDKFRTDKPQTPDRQQKIIEKLPVTQSTLE